MLNILDDIWLLLNELSRDMYSIWQQLTVSLSSLVSWCKCMAVPSKFKLPRLSIFMNFVFKQITVKI
jgi:hypothetical protein